jgi:hypothetical protein
VGFGFLNKVIPNLPVSFHPSHSSQFSVCCYF